MSKRLTIDISELRKKLHSVSRLLADEEVIYVMRHGKLSFALCSMDFFESIEETLEILRDYKAAQMFIDSIQNIS